MGIKGSFIASYTDAYEISRPVPRSTKPTTKPASRMVSKKGRTLGIRAPFFTTKNAKAYGPVYYVLRVTRRGFSDQWSPLPFLGSWNVAR